MLRRQISFALFLCVISCWPAAAAASVPDWLRSAAQQAARKYPDDVDAVVLLDQREVTVKGNSDIVIHRRIVYRILRPEGRSVAEHGVPFDSETRINFFRGWSLTARGQEYEIKDKDAVEVSTTTFEVFSDDKVRILKVPGADVGSVVGFEYEQRERPYVFETIWHFQRGLPVERGRYELRLPAGWEYRAEWVNHPQQAPVNQNGAEVWEISDVPRIEDEYRRPPAQALSGRMVVTFYSEKIRDKSYRTWNDLGAWQAQLIAGTRDASPGLKEKVKELAPKELPLLDRIRALARFAQRDVRYAAIEVGIGGLKPHPASEIFAHRYGDCKDKATVLITMLNEIGVKSYYMPIHDQRGIFTEKTPPSIGFNHVILAVQLPEGSYQSPMPAIYEHPRLGHLLIFDPTNDLVPFGQLPYYEQDSYALLVTDAGGEFIHLPVSKPEMNSIKRTGKLKLLPDGTLEGEIEEVRSGYHAMTMRGYLKNQSQQDRKKIMERILGRAMGSLQIESFNLENIDDIEKDFIVRYRFRAEHYAKNAGQLLLVRPRVVGEKAGYFDSSKPRHYAYEMEAPSLDSDNIEIGVPAGFKVDELPDPARASFSFGEYMSRIEASDSVLRYSREYKMRTPVVPLERIGELKKLFAEINADEQRMAVLARK